MEKLRPDLATAHAVAETAVTRSKEERAKIKQQKNQFYKATLAGYGNLLGSEDDMATHIHAGDGHWTVTGVWQHIGNLWRLIPPVN